MKGLRGWLPALGIVAGIASSTSTAGGEAAEVEVVDAFRSYYLYALTSSPIEGINSDACPGEFTGIGPWNVSDTCHAENFFELQAESDASIEATSDISNLGAFFTGSTIYEYWGCGECRGWGISRYIASFVFDVAEPIQFVLGGEMVGQYGTAQLEKEGDVLFADAFDFGSLVLDREILLEPGQYTFSFEAAVAETLSGTGSPPYTLTTTFDVHVDYSAPTPVGANSLVQAKSWAETKSLFR